MNICRSSWTGLSKTWSEFDCNPQYICSEINPVIQIGLISELTMITTISIELSAFISMLLGSVPSASSYHYDTFMHPLRFPHLFYNLKSALLGQFWERLQ